MRNYKPRKKDPMVVSGNVRDLRGQRFGKVVVHSYNGPDKNKAAVWVCKCDCGKDTLKRTTDLVSGKTFSCGCSRKNFMGDDFTKFWAKVMKLENGCWEWQGSRHNFGYGQTRYQGKAIYAHRLSYIINIGEVPQGLQVLHKCDNPPCCNPDHLFIGTIADNMKDMHAKGRNRNQFSEDRLHAR